jgi:hypothetical protein
LTPFDDFTLSGDELCGVDLAVRYGIAREGALVQLDESGKILDERLVARDGSVCTPLPRAKYGILRLRIRRSHQLRPELQIHYGSLPTPHLLGVIRQPL